MLSAQIGAVHYYIKLKNLFNYVTAYAQNSGAKNKLNDRNTLFEYFLVDKHYNHNKGCKDDAYPVYIERSYVAESDGVEHEERTCGNYHTYNDRPDCCEDRTYDFIFGKLSEHLCNYQNYYERWHYYTECCTY